MLITSVLIRIVYAKVLPNKNISAYEFYLQLVRLER